MNTTPITVYSWRNEPQSDLRGLTAASLLAKVELAESGDTRELFALYRDLLASDSQLQMEFENRKRAVLGDTSALLPFDKSSPADLAAREACRPLLGSAPFETAKAWLLNACLYPVAVCEKVYAPAPGGYALAQIVPVPYQLLDYREGTLRIFDTDARGDALPTSRAPDPERYVVHRGHTLPLPDNWGGPMRSILFWILLRTMSRQWWADLLERYGMPFLKGKYSDDKGKTVLQSAFAVAQRLGGIVVHKNTEVEIVQAAAGDSSNSHERFIELCNKEISKLVAGQTLSSNAQPTGLGNGATPLQGAVRDDIRKSDAQRLAATLRSQLLAPYCRINAVPGRVPLLVFGSDSASEMRELIGTVSSLAAAGLEPDDDGLAALSERVGFGLRRKAASPAAPGAAPFPFRALPLAAGEPAGKPRETPAPDPLAEIVRTSSSATECLRRLREAIANRPLDDQAAFLAEAMELYARRALSLAPETVDANGMEHGDHSGRFVGKGGDREPETRPHHDRFGSTDENKLASEPRRNQERGTSALEDVMCRQSGYVDKAMYREETGWIRFDWGWEGNPHKNEKGDTYVGGHGISHIAAKHPADLKFLPEVLAKGEIYRHPDNPEKFYFVHEMRFAVVASLHKGAKKTITEYEPDRAKEIATIKTYPRAKRPGDN